MFCAVSGAHLTNIHVDVIQKNIHLPGDNDSEVVAAVIAQLITLIASALTELIIVIGIGIIFHRQHLRCNF